MTRLAPGKPETITLGRLLDHRFPPREDLIAPWLRQGESVMLWAAPGTGKSLLALTWAVMVAGGGSVLGWQAVKPRRVLLVDGEVAAEDLQERAALLIGTVQGIDREAARANLLILARTWQREDVPFPDLNDREGRGGVPSGQTEVLDRAKAWEAELVILDNYSTLAEVADENDAAAMTPTLAFLLRLKQARIGCVLVHHSGKTGETYRGSSKLATTFEVIVGLKPLGDTVGAGGAAFRIDWTKFRRKPCDAVRSREIRLQDDLGGNPQWSAASTKDDDMRLLLEAVRSGKFTTQGAIAAHLGWVPSKVTTVKGRAAELGVMARKDFDGYLKDAVEGQLEGGPTDF